METPKKVEEQGPVYEIVPESKQKEAVEFINANLFQTPTWLINQDIYGKVGMSGLTVIGSIQDQVLNRLLGSRTLTKLIDAEGAMGNRAYQVMDLLGDLKKGIWNELSARKPVDIYRRNLQKSYTNILLGLLKPASSTVTFGSITVSTGNTAEKTDIKSVVRAHLVQLRNEINSGAAVISDPMTKYHLQDLSRRIDIVLNPN